MNPSNDLQKTMLNVDLIHLAYGHPKWTQVRFPGSPICPRCHAEIAFVLQEDETKRLLSCQNCGMHYATKELAA